MSLLFGTQAAAQSMIDFVVEPGRRAGPVAQDTTEAQLRAMLPKGQVKRVLSSLGEGTYGCSTEIFAGTDHAATIDWGTMTQTYEDLTSEGELKILKGCQDLPPASRPTAITIEKNLGRSPIPSTWRTKSGIHLGMTVRELEALLGKPFTFSVCACDSAGVFFTDQNMDALRGIELWFEVPDNADVTFKKMIKPDGFFALKSSDVPKRLAKNFVVRKLIISINSIGE